MAVYTRHVHGQSQRRLGPEIFIAPSLPLLSQIGPRQFAPGLLVALVAGLLLGCAQTPPVTEYTRRPAAPAAGSRSTH